ncbi:PREDICTED: immunoglobulin iota chain-like [Cyprinodon variegatus]|uniref:immunoglobulin iota chain-like n=1 Tax=Cyprinodon variegatus TaxID=28743 RepID=UPI000742678D|nr:PREDICTED: immunoglobulin iota chain-like [Cyprinodon variegatus]
MLSLLTSGFTLLVLLIGTGINCQHLTATKSEESSLEENSVTLSCTYSQSAAYGDYIFWYRQNPGKPPEYLVSHSGTGDKLQDPVPGFSFRVNDDKTQMDLLISSAAETDSAVYYCAVRPTVTGNTRTLYKNLQYSTTSTRGPHTLFLLYGLRDDGGSRMEVQPLQDISTMDRVLFHHLDVFQSSSVLLSDH